MLSVVFQKLDELNYMVSISACFPLEPIKMRNFQGYFPGLSRLKLQFPGLSRFWNF